VEGRSAAATPLTPSRAEEYCIGSPRSQVSESPEKCKAYATVSPLPGFWTSFLLVLSAVFAWYFWGLATRLAVAQKRIAELELELAAVSSSGFETSDPALQNGSQISDLAAMSSMCLKEFETHLITLVSVWEDVGSEGVAQYVDKVRAHLSSIGIEL
jgi:hypothetical protein